nr:hypothetical protein [Lactiplantibacillus plantarum]
MATIHLYLVRHGQTKLNAPAVYKASMIRNSHIPVCAPLNG